MSKIINATNDHSIPSHKNPSIENKTDDENVYEFKNILNRHNGMKTPLPMKEKIGRKFCMVKDSTILYLNHWKEKNVYHTQWELMEQGTKRPIGTIIPSKNPINVDNQKRDNRLKEIITKSTEIKKQFVEEFLLGIVDVSNYLDNRNTLFPEKEPETEEQEVNQINGFEDYEEHIKTEANDIFNADPLKFFLEACKEHYGDEENKEILFLVYFAKHPMNGKPVHVSIIGTSDVGKTSLALKTARIIPDRFRISTNTMSAKAAYYHHNRFRDDYNHLIINDFMDSQEAIGTLKAMTDTEIDNPTHMTVSESKEAVELVIKGKNTLILTASQQIIDGELNRRLLHINPDESEEQQAKVKESIAKNEAGIGSNTYDPIFDVCKAVYDKIIEKQYNVFVPCLRAIETQPFSKTDFKIFSNLVKARALIYQAKRIKIDDKTIVASLEDIEEVQKLWNGIQNMQTTYLQDKALKILDVLPEWDMSKFDGKPYGKRLAEIAKEIDFGRSSVERWIFGDDDFKGLEDLGLVKSEKTGDWQTAPWIFYRIKSDEEKEALLVGHFDMKKQIREDSNQRKIIQSICDFFIDNEIYTDTHKEKLFELVSQKIYKPVGNDKDIPLVYQLAKEEYENFL